MHGMCYFLASREGILKISGVCGYIIFFAGQASLVACLCLDHQLYIFNTTI